MKVVKIETKYYQEVDLDSLKKELETLIDQKKNINYDLLKEEYEQNVKSLQEYENSLDEKIKQLESLIKE